MLKIILHLKNNLPSILITGANGQLGNEFKNITARYPEYHFLFVSKNELTIENFNAVEKYFNNHVFDYCVNCAAYTAVDKAETEKEKAFAVNADAVGQLARICQEAQTGFIHISTDYVFNGKKNEPYKEEDSTQAINVYGASKLKGEQLTLQYHPSALILRTSWLYAAHGNNFVKTMLRLMQERENIQVVDDQFGCPTYAADLADVIMQIIISKKTKNKSMESNIFNYANAGVTNWYHFAETIKEFTGSRCNIHPIPTAGYPTPAARPAYSVLDTQKIQKEFGIGIPFWKDSLQQCLSLLKSK